MHLRKIWPDTPKFYAPCKHCGKVTNSDDLWADTDGAPFDFVCNECAQRTDLETA